MEYAAFLRSHIEELVCLSDEDFQTLLLYFKPVEIRKKDYIIKVSQWVNAEYLVVSGCLASSVYGPEGKEYIMQFAQEKWWVSDYPSLAEQKTAEMNVQALEDSFVLELTAENRSELCEKVPIMHTFFERKTFGGYVGSQKRVLSLLRDSAKEKYELLLEQYPELFQRLPQKIIAQYLGVSRETLSRLTRKE